MSQVISWRVIGGWKGWTCHKPAPADKFHNMLARSVVLFGVSGAIICSPPPRYFSVIRPLVVCVDHRHGGVHGPCTSSCSSAVSATAAISSSAAARRRWSAQQSSVVSKRRVWHCRRLANLTQRSSGTTMSRRYPDDLWTNQFGTRWLYYYFVFVRGFTVQGFPATGPHHHLQSEVWPVYWVTLTPAYLIWNSLSADAQLCQSVTTFEQHQITRLITHQLAQSRTAVSASAYILLLGAILIYHYCYYYYYYYYYYSQSANSKSGQSVNVLTEVRSHWPTQYVVLWTNLRLLW